MRKSLLALMVLFTLPTSFVANGGVVVESTRYLYKEGSREISAQLDNKDATPYLMKSWVEAPEGGKSSYFMVTPPLFRLEANQKNTVRIFPNAHISGAPRDRDSVYFFNVMSIPPTENDGVDNNKLQLAVRHRMRLVYRPQAIQKMSVNEEAKKIEWRRSNGKISVKNPTPFFIYFNSIKVNGKEISNSIPHIDAFSTKEFTLPADIKGNTITWKIATEHGGSGPENSTTI